MPSCLEITFRTFLGADSVQASSCESARKTCTNASYDAHLHVYMLPTHMRAFTTWLPDVAFGIAAFSVCSENLKSPSSKHLNIDHQA